MAVKSVRTKAAANILRGSANGGVVAFRGIRYAETEGGTRFGLPHAVHDQIDVDSLAGVPIFPQLPSRLSAAMGRGRKENPQSDGAFFLNVWTPQNADKLPVLFFIHGGAWTTGGGAQEWYDGARLASEGVIVVTVNYRLGPLGHLVQAADEGTHLPLADLLCALRWVNEHIAGLGGDPDQVTIVGQSAGAWYGHLLTVLPESQGLLRRVAHLSMSKRALWSPSRQRQVYSMVIGALNGRDPAMVPTGELLRAGAKAVAGTPTWPPSSNQGLGYVGSGYLPSMSPGIPRKLLNPLWSASACHAEAVLFRYTAEESAMFFFNSPRESKATPEQVDELLATWDPADLPPPGRLHPVNIPECPVGELSPYQRLVALSSWSQFQRLSEELRAAYASAGISTELHIFSSRSPQPRVLAGHCYDLPFQFGNRHAWSDAPMLNGVDDETFKETSEELIHQLIGFVQGAEQKG